MNDQKYVLPGLPGGQPQGPPALKRGLPVGWKFLTKQYADRLVEEGSIKIGTAKEFRHDDGKVGGRYDPHECMFKFEPGETQIEVDANHWLAKKMEMELEAKKMTMIIPEGTSFVFHTNSYIYCMSTELTDDLSHRMLDIFGCDACVKINDTYRFGNILADRVMPKETSIRKGFWFAQCMYKDHDKITVEELEDNLEPLIKKPEFAWQKEQRIIFNQPNADSPPIIFTDDRISGLVTRVY